MAWNFTSNKRRILSEAPMGAPTTDNQNADMDVNQFQPDPEILGDAPESGTAQPQGEIPGDTQGSTDAQATGEEMPTDDPTMDPAMDGEMAGQEEMVEPELPQETPADRIKKLTLLKQYKELIELLHQTEKTITIIERSNLDVEKEHFSYIGKQIEDTERKISHTITYKFLSEDYRSLLRLYYYYRLTITYILDYLDDLCGGGVKANREGRKIPNKTKNKSQQ